MLPISFSNSMTNLSDTARTIFHQALTDCSIEQALARHVCVQDAQLYLDGEGIDLSALHHIRIVAAGKAANPMLSALLRRLPPLPHCTVTGVVIAPEIPPETLAGFQFFRGGHPLPDEQSFAGARAALEMAHAAATEAEHTLCLFLISGGASAMMELPLDPSITIEETAAFHLALVASGAPIAEMNCVRKHFSAIKGGRLAQAAQAALCRSLLISDVPKDRRDALASGPTVPDSTTVEECREILMRHHLLPRFPATVRRFFESSALPETSKKSQLTAVTCTLLDSENLAETASQRAQALGYTAIVDNSCDEWDYREAAQYLLDRLRNLQREHERVCLISAGEVTVSLPANSAGIGGRNQQFALYAATLLSPSDGAVAILSVGSDGIDGNSPAAGAVIDEETVAEPADRNASLQALAGFNAHPFLTTHNATLVTGPSGNNLRDLRILLSECTP